CQAANEMHFEHKLRICESRRVWDRRVSFNRGHERILVPGQDHYVELERAVREPLWERQNGETPVWIHAHAIWRCSLQDVLKLMSRRRKRLMSRPKVTCASRSVRSLTRFTVPLASMVIVTETSPPISSACPWKRRNAVTFSCVESV